MAKLPPLNALRAFEAAARHEGFIKASEELHVTRGAISRQIKLLEAHLGAQLFARHAQGVSLTPTGRQLLPVLTEAFNQIATATDRITSDAGELRVICPPGTSMRWLLPKLDRFQDQHPDFRVRLTTDFHAKGGYDSTEADVGFSVTNWPDRPPSLAVEPIFPVVLTPACSADYLRKMNIAKPNDLANCQLLHESKNHADWTAWTTQFAPNAIDPKEGQDFPNLDMATKAAAMGAGVVMADLVLCREELEAGTLVTPFPNLTCASPLGEVCLIADQAKWSNPNVTAFRNWVQAEAQQDREHLQRHWGI